MRGISLWWRSPALWLVIGLTTVIPFFFVDVPPLTDLPNHIARYYIFMNIDHSPFLSNYYNVRWELIGNLGVDIVVRAIGPFLGAELATRIAVGIIPPLTVAGIYSTSCALNGKVAPSALVALPLAYNWPLDSGFVNFSLSAAMALLVFALWIRLRSYGFFARLLIFAPLSFATWVAHTAGWGLLGLAVLGFELERAYQRGLNLRSLLDAALATLPFALMVAFTIFWRSGTSGTGVVFASNMFSSKVISMASIFREEYWPWDLCCLLLFLTLTVALFFAGGRRVVVAASVIAALFALAFLVCPEVLFNSAFADRRLLPYAGIFVPLSVGVADQVLDNEKRIRILSILSMSAILLFVARIAVTTGVWERSHLSFERHLRLLEQIPRHSRIFGLMVEACNKEWSRMGRLDHLQQLALTRRESLVNGLFQESGLNQVEARIRKLEGFDPNLLAKVHDESCPVTYSRETLQSAIAHFPRDQFDFVWLIAPNALPAIDTSGLRLIGADGNDRLYQIESR
jgi:hypothetical protein